MKTRYFLALAAGTAALMVAVLYPVLSTPGGRPSLAGTSAGKAPADTKAAAGAFRELDWVDLIPKDWDPYKGFDAKDMDAVNDASPQALALMDRMRATWDNAPTVAAMEGAKVRLPGYVVPLETDGGVLKEFLLVPYFGACIHTPPPPANQIIHVVTASGSKDLRSMDTVWVSGTLNTARRNSSMGMSGYQLAGAIVEPYLPPKQP